MADKVEGVPNSVTFSFGFLPQNFPFSNLIFKYYQAVDFKGKLCFPGSKTHPEYKTVKIKGKVNTHTYTPWKSDTFVT